MVEIDIKEIKELKSELNFKIQSQLNEFTKKTGLDVSSIDIIERGRHIGGDKITNYFISLEVIV